MGKKRTITMDQNQEEELDLATQNKYKEKSFDMADEFAELEALYAKEAQESKTDSEDGQAQKTAKAGTQTASKARTKRIRSKKYQALRSQIDRDKFYSLDEALDKVLTLTRTRFPESIELHLQTRKNSLSGSLNLPHGTGKTKSVVVFDDKVLKQIESQKIDFDILVAKREDMAKLAKYAKFLGPRGLMPNPKNGTITDDPEAAVKELSGGKIHFKTEKKAPLIHLTVGKTNFAAKQLSENLNTVFTQISPRQVVKASICSSMGPGIKIDLNSIQTEK
jgi:large subunit ribosomal protein L1